MTVHNTPTNGVSTRAQIPKRDDYAMENEKGVTPIVGTIMLVALTVVLAAIVAAFQRCT